MTWTVLVASAARKQLAKLPANDQRRIAVALQSMSEDAFSGDILKLHGMENRWRRRAGSYSIFFAVDTATLTVSVSAIVRRTSTTY
jgi:mRNA-degrading endonuclease RelE of RelBE toxin-antitoxin system